MRIIKQFVFISILLISITSCSDMLGEYLQSERVAMQLSARDITVNHNDTFYFGNLMLGQTGLTTEFIIQNTGNSELQIKDIALINGHTNDLLWEGGGYENIFGWYNIADVRLDQNTGTWIHCIIYRSLEYADTYYFGFEDLYNPSDNDFEDTFVKAEGLLPYNY